MNKIWMTLRLAYYFIRVSIAPTDTAAALGIGESIYGLGFTKEMCTRLESDADCAKVIREKKLMNRFDLIKLQKLPLGTQGRCYADHMIGMGLNPDFFKPMQVTNVASFCMLRLRQTHDLWHVALGFDTSVPGEIGLQSFYFSQVCAPIAPFLIGGALFGASFKNRAGLEPLFKSIMKGWQMGRLTKPLFPLDWEANWETPLTDLRLSLGLSATPDIDDGNASIRI